MPWPRASSSPTSGFRPPSRALRAGHGSAAQGRRGLPERRALALIQEFVEVESGKNDERPKLAEALALCRLHNATLVIAKLDRLSRDAHFLLGLQKAGVRFVAADMPEANEMVVGIMAVVAQAERKMISKRTKAALAAAKARGTKLGGNRGNLPAVGRSRPRRVDRCSRQSERRAEQDDMKPGHRKFFRRPGSLRSPASPRRLQNAASRQPVATRNGRPCRSHGCWRDCSLFKERQRLQSPISLRGGPSRPRSFSRRLRRSDARSFGWKRSDPRTSDLASAPSPGAISP